MPDPCSLIPGSAWARGLMTDPANRERDDYTPTEPAAVRALLAVEDFDGTIWEPACGDGAISKVLLDAGHKVFSTDLIDRGYGLAGWDFLDCPPVHAGCIVTNPPFKHADAFVYRALDCVAGDTGKVAMLLRLAYLEGIERRARMWEPPWSRTPFARVWVFSRRLNMWRGGVVPAAGKGGGMIAYAWFVWQRGHVGPWTGGFLDTAVEGLPSSSEAVGRKAREQGSESGVARWMTVS